MKLSDTLGSLTHSFFNGKQWGQKKGSSRSLTPGFFNVLTSGKDGESKDPLTSLLHHLVAAAVSGGALRTSSGKSEG